jgi:DNA-binding LacI/PurR family transcriptional regulator
MAENGKVTLSMIASRLGVSDTTVSLVLSGRGERYRISKATIQRVRQTALKLGYRPSLIARQLAGKRSHVIGVLVNTQAIADVRMIQAMEVIAAERGVRFIVGHAVGTQEQVTAYLDDFEARGVDGVISIFHNHPDYSSTVLKEMGRFANVVYFEKPADAAILEACYVEPDFDAIGRLGARHLMDRGRRRIGAVFSNLEFPYAVKRMAAHHDVLTQGGRPAEPELTWVLNRETSFHWSSSITRELALRAVDELVVKRNLDGIVAVNDLYAARLIGALRQRGLRVPDDVAVVGCDNMELGTLVDPALTTMWCDTDTQARAVIDMLFAQLDEGRVPEDRRVVSVAPELIIRGSS